MEIDLTRKQAGKEDTKREAITCLYDSLKPLHKFL